MNDRFKFRVVLKTDKFTILVEPFYVLDSCYFIDTNKAEVEFECKYPNECFWDFVEEIEKQDYIQEISVDSDLIITKDFTNLIQCTGLKDKNGKLIYEGDIVKDELKNIFTVSFSKDYLAYLLTYIDNPKETMACYPNIELEVIGNIYENPELLKDGE